MYAFRSNRFSTYVNKIIAFHAKENRYFKEFEKITAQKAAIFSSCFSLKAALHLKAPSF